MKTKLLIVAAALPLAACISFGAKPPPSLLTLEATAAPAVGADQNSAKARSITIQVPSTPTAIAGARVPVQATPTTIAYVKDAQWAEPPARLFARLLSDTVSARGLVVLSTVQSIGDPSSTLAGELRRFGLDATSREAIVTYDAALTRAGKDTVEKHRFEARVPVATIDATSAGPALSQAANQVAGEVATWVAAN
ncbi:ABC-type transport auxiliary lipoprotein family protein [Sphingomonas sp. RP10(2022)]|uniref:ABC-type transport auxiliary lipoprotein family protein n=1 Tax=Sphingomonas liriopis TaxID=2949094 RepID=A0A9X2HWY9_9SPHN|nr:ABC-type transport auxiliary lipoprotein family protein [Sphingomonas liriopis]MCP3734330.1 ABC-type transport auxiliary lipoprotein family protein [Sphingomonas liriopis]